MYSFAVLTDCIIGLNSDIPFEFNGFSNYIIKSIFEDCAISRIFEAFKHGKVCQ
jgi:hypothetical protein